MALVIPPTPTYLLNLPNPIRADISHVAVEQLDGGHAQCNVPPFKDMKKWGKFAFYVPMGPVGFLTSTTITMWGTKQPPITPPGSEKKLILSKASFDGPMNAYNENLDAMFAKDWADPTRPLVNFFPYGSQYKNPTLAPCPHSVGSLGMSASEWPIMFLWCVAAAAMPEPVWTKLKANGLLTKMIDAVIRGVIPTTNGWFPWYNKPDKTVPPCDYIPMARLVAVAANAVK